MYNAHARRITVERMDAVRNAVISGIWANTNIDDTKEQKGLRADILQKLFDNHMESVRRVYGVETAEDLDLKSDPLFAAMKVPPMPEELQQELENADQGEEEERPAPDVDQE